MGAEHSIVFYDSRGTPRLESDYFNVVPDKQSQDTVTSGGPVADFRVKL